MSWTSQITNAGGELLRSMLGGTILTITRAEIGSDFLPDEDIKALTEIGNKIPALVQVEKEDGAKPPTVTVRINNRGVTETAVLHQVGLFAEMPDGSEILFAVYQNEFGEEIPSEAEYPDLNLTFHAALDISVTDNIVVVISHSAFVTVEELDRQIASHNTDPTSHADIRALALNSVQRGEVYTTAESDAALAAHNSDANAHGAIMGNITQMQGEVSRLEGEVEEMKLRIDTNITANPFSVTFDTLDGLDVSGVFNTERGTVDF